MPTFAPAFERLREKKVDPLAQSVEHNTFNVGVLGSSPKRITEKRGSEDLSFCYKKRWKKARTRSWARRGQLWGISQSSVSILSPAP